MRFRLSSRRAESWARMSVERVAGAEVWAARRRAARILREMLIRKEKGVRSQEPEFRGPRKPLEGTPGRGVECREGTAALSDAIVAEGFAKLNN